MGEGNCGQWGLRGGQGLEVGEGIAPTLKDLPSMVPEVKDKEGPSSSKLITKKAPQAANPLSAKGMTMPEGNILEAGTGKVTSATSVKESIPGQTTSETAVMEFTQDQSSETAMGGAAALNQATSEAATGDATLDQTTSEEAVGGAELIQSPPASCTDNQTPPASPMQGATTQISPSKLTGNLSTLELDKAQVRPTTPR